MQCACIHAEGICGFDDGRFAKACTQTVEHDIEALPFVPCGAQRLSERFLPARECVIVRPCPFLCEVFFLWVHWIWDIENINTAAHLMHPDELVQPFDDASYEVQ